jgi:hypothetical protein
VIWRFSVQWYIYILDMEGNIRIYRLLKGRGTDQWKWYCRSRRLYLINKYTIYHFFHALFLKRRKSI